MLRDRFILSYIFPLSRFFPQKRKTTTISVEVKKSQHKYIVGPKGNTLQEIMESTGVSVEMPPLDSDSETIILRGEPDKLGPALTQVYAKVRNTRATFMYLSPYSGWARSKNIYFNLRISR